MLKSAQVEVIRKKHQERLSLINNQYVMKHEKRPQYFSLQLLILLAPDVPHQSNSNDCGVFLLEFMRYIAQGKPFDFFCSEMPQFREEIRKEIENKVIRKAHCYKCVQKVEHPLSTRKRF